MGKNKKVFTEAVSEMKYFLLGSALVLALVMVVPALAQISGGMQPPSGGMQMQPPSGGMQQPSGGQQMQRPAGGQQMQQPAGGQQMQQPSGGQQMQQPAGGQQMQQPSGGQQMQRPSGGQQMPSGGQGGMNMPNNGTMRQSGSQMAPNAGSSGAGIFPGKGATNGVFPGKGSTEGVFPGVESDTGSTTTTPVDYSNMMKKNMPVTQPKDLKIQQIDFSDLEESGDDVSTYIQMLEDSAVTPVLNVLASGKVKSKKTVTQVVTKALAAITPTQAQICSTFTDKYDIKECVALYKDLKKWAKKAKTADELTETINDFMSGLKDLAGTAEETEPVEEEELLQF